MSFKGKSHSPATKAKISASLAKKKGPTGRLDGPSLLSGGGGAPKARGPIRTTLGILGAQLKQDIGNKVRSGLMLRPDLAPDDRQIEVKVSRRQRNSGGRQRYMDTVTISRGTDYKTGRVYDKYRRPVASKVRASATRGPKRTDAPGRSKVNVSRKAH